MTDSAGVPWQGRRFPHVNGLNGVDPNDDGAAPTGLMDALRLFRNRKAGEEQVVDSLRHSRLLIPLVAELAESSVNAVGRTIDKSQGLSIVTVSSPDGRRVLPAFTSVAAMTKWDPSARPVPTPAGRVALAAVSENTELVVVDPTSETQFVVRRPALKAIAEAQPWIPSYLDPGVLQEFMDSALHESSVYAVTLAPGDPFARLDGPELLVMLSLGSGLTRAGLDALIERVTKRWQTSALIAARVDSLAVKLVPID